MRKIILGIVLVSIISCSKDEFVDSSNGATDSERVQSLKYESWDHLLKEYNVISKLPQSELETWAGHKAHGSLLLNEFNEEETLSKEKELDLYALTNELKAILNKEMAVQVGENMIYYKNQKFYEVPLSKVGTVTKDQDFSKFKTIGFFEVNSTKLESKDISRRVELGPNQNGPDYQKEFKRKTYQDCNTGELFGEGGSINKHVYDLVTRTWSPGYPEVITSVYLDVKLEYRRRGRWLQAGLHRNISVNVTGNAHNTGRDPEFQNINVSRNISCTTRNVSILLAQARYASNIGLAPRWFINLSGTVSQHMNGDVSANNYIVNVQF